MLAVGTTTVRVLETLARGGPLAGRTSLFVTPGFGFERVDALLTNFHLPRSTLLALVMAFAGVEQTRSLYELAVAERYRFYSFGDAMLDPLSSDACDGPSVGCRPRPHVRDPWTRRMPRDCPARSPGGPWRGLTPAIAAVRANWTRRSQTSLHSCHVLRTRRV